MKKYKVIIEFLDKNHSIPFAKYPVTFELKFEVFANSENEAFNKAKKRVTRTDAIWDYCILQGGGNESS